MVDVNTGKFTGTGGNLEETVTKNNLEAAEEVVRQLRLRDIGGIIVIDFIDMVLESNRDLVLRRLVECLGRDRTKHQVAEVTSLGLVQMTRKRMGTGLLEVFGEQCEACAGRGIVTHDDARRAPPRQHGRRRAPPAARRGRSDCRPHRAQAAGAAAREARAPEGTAAAPSAPAACPRTSPPRPSATPRLKQPVPRWRTSLPRRTPPTCTTARQPPSATRRARQAAVGRRHGARSRDEAAGRPATVLTFGGEQVASALRRARRRSSAGASPDPGPADRGLRQPGRRRSQAEPRTQAGTQARKPEPSRVGRRCAALRPGQRTPGRRAAAAAAATGAPAAPRVRPTTTSVEHREPTRQAAGRIGSRGQGTSPRPSRRRKSGGRQRADHPRRRRTGIGAVAGRS